MREKQRVRMRLAVYVPVLLLAGMACSGEAVEHETHPHEIARLEQHFATVRAELLAAEVSGLDAEQRRNRERHVARLAEYAASGVFPHNHDRAEMTPFFIDGHGTRCAMAYLIEQSGRGDLVARIARDHNQAYIAELAGDPELIVWLDENGLTAAEAARIQPTYECDGSDRPCNPSGGEIVEPGYRPGVAINAAVGVTSGALLAVNLSSREGSKTRGFLGLVAGGLGVTTGLLTLGEDDRERRALGGVNIGIGLVAVAVGLDVMFREPPAPSALDAQATMGLTGQPRRDRGVSVQPLLSGDSVGLAMGGSF